MRFFKRLAGYLGFGHETKVEDDDDNNHSNHNNHTNFHETRPNRINVDPIPAGPRKGFSVPVQVQVPVDRPAVVPVLHPIAQDHAGIQGLRWYAARLKTDEDGDVADEFLYEVSEDRSGIPQDRSKPVRLLVNHSVKRAEIKQQRVTRDGKLQHRVECQGRLQWV